MFSSRIIKWLIILLIAWQWSNGNLAGIFQSGDTGKDAVFDPYGALVLMDTTEKSIYLVFTAHDHNEGGSIIRNTLKEKNVKASFFFTGDFYRSSENKNLIRALKDDGHYLGAHSDKHLLYTDWEDRDSTLVTEAEFVKDLESNYSAMTQFGIKEEDASFFLPSYEWYNVQISDWTESSGLQLINYTPGTGTARDYTWPEMGDRYSGNKEILDDLWEMEEQQDLRGALILIHLGTDPRRKEKLYNELEGIIKTFHRRGYQLKRLN